MCVSDIMTNPYKVRTLQGFNYNFEWNYLNYLLTGTSIFSISETYCLNVLSVDMRSLTVVHA